MVELWDEVKFLRERGQSRDLILLIDLLLPKFMTDPRDQNELTSADYLLLIAYADALMDVKDFRRAKKYYSMALAMRKNMTRLQKSRTSEFRSNASFISAAASTRPRCNSSSIDNAASSTNLEMADLLSRLASSNSKMGDTEEAISLLESIPAKSRDVRVHLTLARLYRRSRSSPSALRSSLRAVLAVSPFSLDTLRELLKTEKITATELSKLIAPVVERVPWLLTWAEAIGFLYSVNSMKAIPLLEGLLSTPVVATGLENNESIRNSLVEAYYYAGNYKRVISLSRDLVSSSTNSASNGGGINIPPSVGLYAAALYANNAGTELESLATRLMEHCSAAERSSAVWLALAYYVFAQNKRDPKALYFAQKVSNLSTDNDDDSDGTCSMSHVNVFEALLLKGSILAAGRNFNEAINVLISATDEAGYRFDAVKALAEVYVEDGRKSMALQLAANASVKWGKTPPTLTLSASVLLAEPQSAVHKKSARSQLEAAVKLDPAYIPAVLKLSALYTEDKATNKNLDLLTRAIEVESNNKLHRMLGELYCELNDQEKALHHHNIASKIEMNLRSSTEPSQRLASSLLESQGSQSEDALEAAGLVDLDADDAADSDIDDDEEEGEGETSGGNGAREGNSADSVMMAMDESGGDELEIHSNLPDDHFHLP